MKNNITIALTSCGRMNFLKKTIKSLEQSCNISQYEKIMIEDSKDKKTIEKVKKENKNGFLKGWKILYTGGIGNTNEEKYFNALKRLYDNIDTKYVFHLQDNWKFKRINFDFIKISESILEKNKNIGIIQLRDFKKDGGFNHMSLTKKQRKEELFKNKVLVLEGQKFLEFRNDKDGASYSCKSFSLDPGLSRTHEMKEIMFSDKTIKRVDEALFGNKMRKKGLKGIKIEPGIYFHLGNSFMSTKIIEHGFLKGIKKTVIGAYKYRIKTLLIQRVIQPLFFSLYKKLDLFPPVRYIMDIFSYLKRKYSISPITQEELTNIEGISEMNIPFSWFTEKKPIGISGVARLRNGDDFLEEVIESHLLFLDELILVDNMSTDNTKEICKKLQKKHPEKIKFFEYTFEVKAQGVGKNQKGDSIYSLAYYYNWCFSKTTYRYVMKVDDDNLFIKEKGEILKKYILENNPQKYITYWGLNLLKKHNNFGVCGGNRYLGKYGDHGIYPVSKYSYYVQKGEVEEFKTNLFFKRKGFSFFHLKFLKKDFGLTNYINSERGRQQLEVIKKSSFIPIKKFTSTVSLPKFLYTNKNNE